jgi:hypothetical protein
LVERAGQHADFDKYVRGVRTRMGISPGKLVDTKDWSIGFLRGKAQVGSTTWTEKPAQPRNQLAVAGRVKVEWVVSDKTFARIVQERLEKAGFGAIKIT